MVPRLSIDAIYAKPFELAYVVTLSEHQLSTDLHVTNTSGTDTLVFQALLHTYIRAPANEVAISPLTGKHYLDKTDSAAIKEEKRVSVDVRGGRSPMRFLRGSQTVLAPDLDWLLPVFLDFRTAQGSTFMPLIRQTTSSCHLLHRPALHA